MSKLTYEEEGQTQEMPTNFGQKLAPPLGLSAPSSQPPTLSQRRLRRTRPLTGPPTAHSATSSRSPLPSRPAVL